jgi:DNA mismatch repair protein MutS
VKVLTKGTITEGELLGDDKNNFLAAVYIRSDDFAVAFADVSTGDVYVNTKRIDKASENEIINELSRFSPVEVIFNEKFLDYRRAGGFIKSSLDGSGSLLDDADFDIKLREKILLSQFSKDDIS